MGLMKNKFIELCKKNNLEHYYDRRSTRIWYGFADENEYRNVYTVYPNKHTVTVNIHEPVKMGIILEFAGFVSTLIDKEKE